MLEGDVLGDGDELGEDDELGEGYSKDVTGDKSPPEDGDGSLGGLAVDRATGPDGGDGEEVSVRGSTRDPTKDGEDAGEGELGLGVAT